MRLEARIMANLGGGGGGGGTTGRRYRGGLLGAISILFLYLGLHYKDVFTVTIH